MHEKNTRGFTLIELLVVVAIIAVLMAREQGKRVLCLSNLRQLSLAFILYADGHAGYRKWRAAETIRFGQAHVIHQESHFKPTTELGKEDAQWVQKGIWGKLGC